MSKNKSLILYRQVKSLEIWDNIDDFTINELKQILPLIFPSKLKVKSFKHNIEYLKRTIEMFSKSYSTYFCLPFENMSKFKKVQILRLEIALEELGYMNKKTFVKDNAYNRYVISNKDLSVITGIFIHSIHINNAVDISY